MKVVYFMYAKDIITSDSKNAFYGKYRIHHVLDRLIYFMWARSINYAATNKILLQFWGSTGYRENGDYCPEGDDFNNKNKPAVHSGVIF